MSPSLSAREYRPPAPGAIEPPPQFGASVDTQFILGMAKAGDGVKILIDIDCVLSVEELSALETM